MQPTDGQTTVRRTNGWRDVAFYRNAIDALQKNTIFEWILQILQKHNRPTDQQTGQQIDQQTDQQLDQKTDQWTDQRMDGRTL